MVYLWQATPCSTRQAAQATARDIEQELWSITETWKGAQHIKVEPPKVYFGPSGSGAAGVSLDWRQAGVLLRVPQEAMQHLRGSINRSTGTIRLPSGREVHIKIEGRAVVRTLSWGWPPQYQQADVGAALEAAKKPVHVLEVQPALRSSGFQEAGTWLVTCVLPPKGMRQLLVPDVGGTATVEFAAAAPVRKQPRQPQATAHGGGGSSRGGSGRPAAVLGDYMAAATPWTAAAAAAAARGRAAPTAAAQGTAAAAAAALEVAAPAVPRAGDTAVII